MDRRTFVISIAVSVQAQPSAALAQRESKVYRIGYLNLRAGPGPMDEAFVQALRELGYVEGRNLIIDYWWVAEKEEQLPMMAAELVARKVDVIVTSTTPAIKAAMGATTTIPIVMATSADPVGSGLVTSLGHPGGNVTGMTMLNNELAGKRLQLVHEIIPRATRIGVLALGGLSATSLLLTAMRAAAEPMGLEVIAQVVTKPEELPDAFMGLERAGVHALIVQLTSLTFEQRAAIVRLAAQHRLPAMYEIRLFVDAGGLVAYGPDVAMGYRRAAVYVDKIFKGARAADLPIEQPSKFEFVINLKTAKTLGIKIPQALLMRAEEVIQ
jgi:putative ABC transport system substrate-binding protein